MPTDVEHLARLVAAYRSTVDTLPHPVDEPELWRERWARLRGLAAEIDDVAGMTDM
jgi:hypothetical protein